MSPSVVLDKIEIVFRVRFSSPCLQRV